MLSFMTGKVGQKTLVKAQREIPMVALHWDEV
jgi:hypothetical protein